MRKLATIRTISNLSPIAGADRIELAQVDGWKVVVQKGQYEAGQKVIYLEIDSWVPHELAPFLSKGNEPKEYMGIKGGRLKTIRLKGQVSQGLILPFKSIDNYCSTGELSPVLSIQSLNPLEIINAEQRDDVYNSYLDKLLNIIKWEPTIDANLNCPHIGPKPCYLPKSDQERIQNLYVEYSELYKDDAFEATLKLDGTSCIVFLKLDDEGNPSVGVCSRNFELKHNEDSAYFKATQGAREEVLLAYKLVNRRLAFYGEIIGERIQGNKENIHGQQFYLFDIYDIDRGIYLTEDERGNFPISFKNLLVNIWHVPILDSECYIFKETNSIQEILDKSDITSMNGKIAEGIVYKHCTKPNVSFKAINNKFLLAYD